MIRYLITRVRQVDGGYRELYARTRADRDYARAEIARDPAMINSIGVDEYVDAERDGTRTRYVLDEVRS